jgi:hypothetical protein
VESVEILSGEMLLTFILLVHDLLSSSFARPSEEKRAQKRLIAVSDLNHSGYQILLPVFRR